MNECQHRLRMVDTRCPKCRTEEERLWDLNDPGYAIECEKCGNELQLVSTAGVPNPTRASWPDGYFRGQTYDRLKKANKLSQHMANLPPDQRGEVSAEIAKLKKVTKPDKS